MKKILILAFDFPPYVSVGGLRPYGWYKYFKEYGIYPIVVTRQWNNKYGNHLDYVAPSDSKEIIIEITEYGTVIKTPYFPNWANKLMLKNGENKHKFIRRFISGYYEISQWLFLTGPKSKLYIAAKEYLSKNKVDCIIASGDPFILFNYASKLSKKFNTPWIADYRDPWSQNFENQKNIVLKNWNSFLEKRIVKTASLITTVSEFVKVNIYTLIKKKKFFILPNGYDPEPIERITNVVQQNEVLSIGFVGTIYNWHPINSFLSVISNFFNDNSRAKLHLNFYGTNISDELKIMIDEEFTNIKEHITFFPKIPNNILLEELAKNNIMLLFNYYSFMGTKIYDYIGLKRKILLCYSDDKEANELKKKHYIINESKSECHNLQERLINETNSGIIVKDSLHLRKILLELYNEFISKGYIECNSINTEQFSRKIQVKKLSEIIFNLNKLDF